MLEIARRCYVWLNYEKLLYKKQEVEFFGETYTTMLASNHRCRSCRVGVQDLAYLCLMISCSNKVIILKQKLKSVFNWIKTWRKATYKWLQARTSYFTNIKKQGLYSFSVRTMGLIVLHNRISSYKMAANSQMKCTACSSSLEIKLESHGVSTICRTP